MIPAGQTSGKITVAVNGDTTDEGDETFTLTLSGPSGVTLADASGTATIRDDDAPDHSAPVLVRAAARPERVPLGAQRQVRDHQPQAAHERQHGQLHAQRAGRA